MTLPLEITRGPDTGGVQFKVAEPFDGPWEQGPNGAEYVQFEGRDYRVVYTPEPRKHYRILNGRFVLRNWGFAAVIVGDVLFWILVATLIALMAKAVAS